MAIVYHFVNNLIDKDEILPDGFFVEHAAIVSENLHHSVKNIQHVRWLDIVSRRGYEIDSKLLREKVIYPINILH